MSKIVGSLGSTDHIRDAWENLGMAFAINESKVRDADPERTLLASLKEFQDDRKLLKLVLSWLTEYGDLVHVERLKALTLGLSDTELAWLGGIARHQIYGQGASGDRRWLSVMKFVNHRLNLSNTKVKTSALDKLQARKAGADKHFQFFGITIPSAEASDNRKLRPRIETLKECLWLRMRVLFGTNWRADVAAIMLLGQTKTSYQAGRALGCSAETAYRNWKSLQEAGMPKLLKGVA